jgi:hypothetical protein
MQFSQLSPPEQVEFHAAPRLNAALMGTIVAMVDA